MHNFDYMQVPRELEATEITNLLLAIREYKVRQQYWEMGSAEILTALKEMAKVQSVGASNRIEGIVTTEKRLHDLVIKQSGPRTREEEEIAGYRDVLGLIHAQRDYIEIGPSVILQLHRDLLAHTQASYGGRWKDSDNAIIGYDENGDPYVRFRPMPAHLTPDAVERLCGAYRNALAAEVCDPLLLSLRFVFDFVSIHPFNDGNGRMSRLLTVLLMEQNGYTVGRYISIERLIERDKDLYYGALLESSTGWEKGENNEAPFIRYMLSTVLRAYRELEARVGTEMTARRSKAQRVSDVFDRRVGKVTKAMILEECPDISEVTVKRILKELSSIGRIEKVDSGRNTGYVRRD